MRDDDTELGARWKVCCRMIRRLCLLGKKCERKIQQKYRKAKTSFLVNSLG